MKIFRVYPAFIPVRDTIFSEEKSLNTDAKVAALEAGARLEVIFV